MRALEPIIALTILFCVYAAGELIAQKTKAVFSTVLGIAILLLAGFWSGILPRSVIEDAQVTGFGNVIAGILIVSLGTTIDFPELRRQWKVVVTSLVCVVGATLAIILIGYPLIGKEMALSVAPIFAGGSAATLIMTTALDEMGLVTASTLCIVMYVVQKFIGVPIASLLLRRTAVQFRDNPALVAEYSQQQETVAGSRRGLLQLPASFARPSVYLAKLGLVAVAALPGEGHHVQDPVRRSDHLLRYHPDLLQSGHHDPAAGAVGPARPVALRGLRRGRHGAPGLHLRQSDALPLRPGRLLRHQLHLRLPHHHADSPGGGRGLRPN